MISCNPDNIKLSSKEEIHRYKLAHEDCEQNSDNYGGTIELLFCKTHADYHNPKNKGYRPEGTYIFVDSTTEFWV
jgi:hypothetical protein